MSKNVESLENSLSWFLNSGVMPNEGRDGVAERIVLTAGNPALDRIKEVFPDLSSEHDGYWIMEQRRADCCFETALLFLLAGKKLNNDFYLRVGKNILEYLFERSGLRKEDMWNWYVPSNVPRSWWFDDNGWVAAIEIFIGQQFPELDKKYDLIAKGRKSALIMGEAVIRNLTSEKPIIHGKWPDEVFGGEPRKPHWGTPVCVALLLAGEFDMVCQYHQWGEKNWHQFGLSEWAYALISSAVGGKLGNSYLKEQSVKIYSYLKSSEKDGILPSEHCEAPSGKSLADLIYTLNWYLPGLGLVEGGREDFLRLRDFIISIQNPDGSWQGMYDISQGKWAGGDLYEGGANSLYTGWTNTVLALTMMM